MKRLSLFLIFYVLVILLIISNCSSKKWDVPTPTVTGPIEEPGHIFFSTSINLASYGFIEEEFFIEGEARLFDTSTDSTAPQLVGRHPYKTRIVVRRPSAQDRFNGTVLLEWLNVTVGFDIDSDWSQAYEHILRSGYAWVGVSAQRVGIHSPNTGLKSWNPERYGTLDVTADSTLIRDELSYDIFSQAAAAIRNPQEISPLGELVPELLIATGHSQSAIYLTNYYNKIQPLIGIIDGFMIRGGGRRLRTDINVKAFKINSETDLSVMQQAIRRQPDSENLRTWEIAGTSHADEHYMSYFAELQQRDFGAALTFQCDLPLYSYIPFRYAMCTAYDHLRIWIKDGTPPPTGEPIELNSIEPVVEIARDSLGNSLGGIRLPQHDVPTQINSGINTGQGFCRFFGSHKSFDRGTLSRLYPTHNDYFDLFYRSVQKNLKAGYILQADANRMIDEARQSMVGRN